MIIKKAIQLTSSDGFKIAVAQMSQRGASFFVFLLLSKLMVSSEYADFVVVFTLIFVINEVGNSGLLQGVIRYISQKKDNEDLFANVIFTVLLNVFLVQIAVLFFVLFFIFLGFFSEEIKSQIFYILIVVFLTLTMSVYNAIFNGSGKYKYYLGSFLLNSILLVVLVSAAALLGYLSIRHILLIYVLALALTVLYQAFLTKGAFKFFYSKEVTKSIWGFGKWYSLWAILSVVESKFEVFFMTYLSMKNELVYYDIAIKFIVFVQISVTILATLYNPKVVVARDMNELKLIKNKIKKVVFYLCFWNFVSSIIISFFINIYYDGRYDKSIFCYLIVSVGLYFSVLSYPYSSEIYRKGQSKLLFYSAVLGAISKFILALILIPRYGSIGASVNFTIVCGLVFIFSMYLVKRIR